MVAKKPKTKHKIARRTKGKWGEQPLESGYGYTEGQYVEPKQSKIKQVVSGVKEDSSKRGIGKVARKIHAGIGGIVSKPQEVGSKVGEELRKRHEKAAKAELKESAYRKVLARAHEAKKKRIYESPAGKLFTSIFTFGAKAKKPRRKA